MAILRSFRQSLMGLTCALMILGSAMAQDGALRATPAKNLIASNKVLVIAHRGDSKTAPENTLAAFRAAVKKGADLVELDYFHSKDGRQVVFHDKTLDRTTNARQVLGRSKIAIGSQRFDDLRRLDAGSWFAPRFRGERIPLLEEALDIIQQGSVTLIERKRGDAKSCVTLLQKKGLLDQVVVQSFDWRYLANCRKLAPGLALVALGKEELTGARLKRILSLDVQGVGWRQADLRKSDIEKIHKNGLKVWAYTVNEPGRAGALIRQGVDGLITDDPALMQHVRKKLGAKNKNPSGKR